jgi:hypothetical protein
MEDTKMTKYETKVRNWIARDIKQYYDYAMLSHNPGNREFGDPFMQAMLTLGDSIMHDIMHLHRIEFTSTYVSLGDN